MSRLFMTVLNGVDENDFDLLTSSDPDPDLWSR